MQQTEAQTRIAANFVCGPRVPSINMFGPRQNIFLAATGARKQHVQQFVVGRWFFCCNAVVWVVGFVASSAWRLCGTWDMYTVVDTKTHSRTVREFDHVNKPSVHSIHFQILRLCLLRCCLSKQAASFEATSFEVSSLTIFW